MPIVCTPEETTRFNAPAGQTCGQYLSAFLESATGYLLNPNATSMCEYCQYSVGDDYLNTLNTSYGVRWPYFAILLTFCIVRCHPSLLTQDQLDACLLFHLFRPREEIYVWIVDTVFDPSEALGGCESGGRARRSMIYDRYLLTVRLHDFCRL